MSAVVNVAKGNGDHEVDLYPGVRVYGAAMEHVAGVARLGRNVEPSLQGRPPTLIRLALIDVDGTLVGRKGIHPATVDALKVARRSGLRMGLSTGRLGVGTADDYARLVDPDGLHVFQSGAVISKPGRSAECRSALSAISVERLVDLSRDTGIPVELYTERQIWVEASSPATRLHAQHLGVDMLAADLTQLAEPVVSAVWVVPQFDWPELEAAVIAVDDVDVARATTPWAPGLVFVNLTRLGTSKASALRWLAARYGCSTEEVAMIGDGTNDLEAMAVAGYSVAMGDSPAEVRSVCHATVSACDDGGLAEALSLIVATR